MMSATQTSPRRRRHDTVPSRRRLSAPSTGPDGCPGDGRGRPRISLALARKAGAIHECLARNRLNLHERPVAAHVLSLVPETL
jgi:hypothetical protein